MKQKLFIKTSAPTTCLIIVNIKWWYSHDTFKKKQHNIFETQEQISIMIIIPVVIIIISLEAVAFVF